MDSEEIDHESDLEGISGEGDGQGSRMQANAGNRAADGSERTRVSGIGLNAVSTERASEIGSVDEVMKDGNVRSVGMEEFGSGEDLGSASEAKKDQAGKAVDVDDELLVDLYGSCIDMQGAIEVLASLRKSCVSGSRLVARNLDNGKERVLEESVLGKDSSDVNADMSDAEGPGDIGAPDVSGPTKEDEARRQWRVAFQKRANKYDNNTAKTYARSLLAEALDSSRALYASMQQEKLVEEGREFSGRFASAFRKIKDQVARLKSEKQPLIKWVPAKEQNHCHVPSLEDLSMAVLARNSESVCSIDHFPYEVREKLCSLVCDYGKMDSNFMKLLVAGSPEEISVKNCSWMTIKQFNEIFRNCDVKNLRVLRLELCGECMFDFTLSDAFGGSPAKLCALVTLSLKGAAGLTDEGLKSLTHLAPSLKSINLSLCPLITARGIHTLVNAYKLKELYLDECPMIDAMLMLPAFMELKILQVLSVAGVPTVTDECVGIIARVCGSNMKELRLADCRNLTDKSIQVLGANCPNLTFLNLSNLDKLSDFSLQHIANGCQSIQHLKLHRNRFREIQLTERWADRVFRHCLLLQHRCRTGVTMETFINLIPLTSDEALGAFLEVSGKSLTELSLNSIRKVGPRTSLSIAKNTRDLVSLDLSWCRSLSNEMVGLIVDSCRSLKLLKLFGCTQITEVFLKGHSNPITRIVGPMNMPIAARHSFIKPVEAALRYSPVD